MTSISLAVALAELNPKQKSAVFATEGRVLILAGAGSGKTKVLTLRMAHLIENNQVSPHTILGLTFTNKAAAEMRHRIMQMLPAVKAKKITLGTFHSFCMQVLRKDIHHLGYTTQFSLYEEKEMHRLIALIARDELQQQEGKLPSLTPTIQALLAAQNHSEEESVASSTDLNIPSIWHDQFVQQIQQRLKASMRAHNAVDFDHLILLTVELFEHYPLVLAKYQEQFKYIMIDEYQDTNTAQYRLAQLLSSKHHCLCVVGDDDQSIYGWRGADVKHILAFDQATVIKLEQNYRSTDVILQAANAVIGHNQHRHDKKMWSTQQAGEPIEIFHAPTAEAEAEAVIHRLVLLKQTRNLQWKDCAILYRSNILAKLFETALLKYTWQQEQEWLRGIPHQIYGGQAFYERREIKDLIAYLRVIANPFDQEAILRILNVPRRQISEHTLDLLTQINRQQNLALWDVLKQVQQNDFFAFNAFDFSMIPNKARKGIHQFVTIIEEAQAAFQKDPLHEALKKLIDTIHYQEVIADEVQSQKMRDFKWQNVQSFITFLEEYVIHQTTEGFATHITLQDFIGSLALDERELSGKQKKVDPDHVHLMTFHSAKGLEFTVCFLVGMEDHIIPHTKSYSLEEERRLMYVAMTRAKQYLCCSMTRKRKYLGRETATIPSRFLQEIPKQYLRITTWNTS